MTLPELCEPVFQRVCLLYRSASVGGRPDFQVERTAFKRLFEDELPRLAKGDSTHLWQQYEKVHHPLMFFVDDVISRESRLSFAARWNDQRIAFDIKQLGGDDKFFELLEETLSDPSEDAVERLQIYHTCFALGFSGSLSDDWQELQSYLNQVTSSLRRAGRLSQGDGMLSPQAYEHTKTGNFQPPRKMLGGIIVALVVMLFVILVGNIVVYRLMSQDLREAVNDRIIEFTARDVVEAPASSAPAAGDQDKTSSTNKGGGE